MEHETDTGRETRGPAELEPSSEGFPSLAGAVESIDVESALAILRKRLWVIALAVLIAVGAATAKAFTDVPIYAASARVQLGREPMDPSAYKYTLVYDNGLSSDYLNTESYLLRSRQLAALVLQKKPEVEKELVGSADPIGALQAALSVRPIRDSFLVEISCESDDPKQATLFANAFSEVYCEYKQDERSRVTNSNVGAINKQLPVVAARIKEVQAELDEYTKKANAFDKEKDLVFERLRVLNEDLNQAQRERVRADSEVDAIENALKAGRPIESAPSIAASANAQRLRADLASVEIELAQLSDRYTDDCPLPKVRSLRARRDELKLELTQEIETIRATNTSYRDAKLGEERRFEALVQERREEARRLDQQAQRYLLLQKEREDNYRRYDELLHKSSDLSTYQGIEGSPTKVIDLAREPAYPVRPNRPKLIALGAILGLLSGLGLAWLLEKVDTRLRSAEDVRAYLQAELFGLVPDVDETASPELERLALAQPESPFAEAFRRIRAQVHAAGPSGVVLVTSGAPAEGKTVASINLAIATANTGTRVVLVDADMRSPAVHKAFGLDVERGLADLLADPDADPADLARETEVPNLYVVTAGRPPRNPAEILARGDSFARIVEKLRARFGRVVIDTPPAALLSDASIMASTADMVILVVSATQSRRRATLLANTSLQGVGSKPAGVILNHVSASGLTDLYYYYYGKIGRDPEKKDGGPVVISRGRGEP